ncbi:hypothetical protein [Streptomyces mirabilis]|uniref:hypothetical protein n=1 Tax=Streptomyces mirabilis TaxID=68239 RepID=UPI0033346996
MSAAPASGSSGGDRHPRLRERWRRVLDEHTTPAQRPLLAAWLAFGCTFGTARLITHGIRGGWLPWGNISAGSTHLHHYNFGIATLAGVGLVAVRGDQAYVGHPGIGALYGTGSALIADEFALLLDLKDVYWAQTGTHQCGRLPGNPQCAGALPDRSAVLA